jgi:hypothetical protein
MGSGPDFVKIVLLAAAPPRVTDCAPAETCS